MESIVGLNRFDLPCDHCDRLRSLHSRDGTCPPVTGRELRRRRVVMSVLLAVPIALIWIAVIAFSSGQTALIRAGIVRHDRLGH